MTHSCDLQSITVNNEGKNRTEPLLYAASFKTHTNTYTRAHARTHGRARFYIDKFVQMFACIIYWLNQYFKIHNSRNTNDAKQPRDLLNKITSRFAQHNHLAICSAQSPRDLLSTITSRFAQHNHLAICSAQSPRDLLKTITSLPLLTTRHNVRHLTCTLLQWLPGPCYALTTFFLCVHLISTLHYFV